MANSINNIDDKALMQRVMRKDHEAFSILVHRHTSMFYAAAYRICSDQGDAEDIVQDAFLKLWNNPKIWDKNSEAKFTTWFYRIVINQAIDYMRRKKPASDSGIIAMIENSSISQYSQIEAQENKDILECAIQSLPERQKLALNLCFYEELSNKQAASILDISVKALESLVMRAKSGLRDEFLRRGMLLGNGKG